MFSFNAISDINLQRTNIYIREYVKINSQLIYALNTFYETQYTKMNSQLIYPLSTIYETSSSFLFFLMPFSGVGFSFYLWIL